MHFSVARRNKLLDRLDVAGLRGLEIGPLTAPLVSKSDGEVIYVDHADTETLRGKYAYDPTVDVTQIVPVDRVWGQQTLEECLGPACKVDYVVNSHVIEHVPDVVSWLGEIHQVLKPSGHLRMAIPDKRYTFDILRTESTLADALDAHLRRARVPLPRAILDHFTHHAEVDPRAIWEGRVDLATIKPTHPPDYAWRAAVLSYEKGEYVDAHCWVFTPISFARLCAGLARLDRLGFVCERIYPTEDLEIEFIVAMRPSPDQHERIESWEAAIRQLEL